jgi:hypothetical protein
MGLLDVAIACLANPAKRETDVVSPLTFPTL